MPLDYYHFIFYNRDGLALPIHCTSKDTALEIGRTRRNLKRIEEAMKDGSTNRIWDVTTDATTGRTTAVTQRKET